MDGSLATSASSGAWSATQSAPCRRATCSPFDSRTHPAARRSSRARRLVVCGTEVGPGRLRVRESVRSGPQRVGPTAAAPLGGHRAIQGSHPQGNARHGQLPATRRQPSACRENERRRGPLGPASTSMRAAGCDPGSRPERRPSCGRTTTPSTTSAVVSVRVGWCRLVPAGVGWSSPPCAPWKPPVRPVRQLPRWCS